jgi:hypothetical protein
MSTAVTVVNKETGEVVTAEPVFQMDSYLADLRGPALAAQHALAAAYDAACASLIGPNDVQVEQGRSFKKKSAWRKLARHFRISTEVVKVSREYVGDTFVAEVTVRALGPWGQYAESLGACATDEAVGRRVITIADAIATAETRATNRAVSNLIAMGEVSAEEMQKEHRGGGSAPRPVVAGQAPPTAADGPVMPFGKTRGTPLSKMDTKDLNGALDWAKSKGKFEEFQMQAHAELVRRGQPSGTMQDFPEALEDDGDDLPFA